MSARDKGCWDFFPGLLTCGCSWLCCFVAFSKSQCFSEVNNHDVLWCRFSCQAAWHFPWHYPCVTLHNPAVAPNHPSQFKLRSFIFYECLYYSIYRTFLVYNLKSWIFLVLIPNSIIVLHEILNGIIVRSWTLSIIFSCFPWELIVSPFLVSSYGFHKFWSSPTQTSCFRKHLYCTIRVCLPLVA